MQTKENTKDYKENKEPAPPCCQGCLQWKIFGKECWVYWDNKKSCTMYVPEFEVEVSQEKSLE